MHIVKTKNGEFMAISDNFFSEALRKDNLSSGACVFIDNNGNEKHWKRPKVRRQDILYGYDVGEVTSFIMKNIKKIMPIIKKMTPRKW